MRCKIFAILNQADNDENNDSIELSVAELFDKLYEYDWPMEIRIEGILSEDEPQCINYTFTLKDDSYEMKTSHGRYYRNTLPIEINTTQVKLNDLLKELQIILSIVYNNEEAEDIEHLVVTGEKKQGGRYSRRNRSYKIKRAKNC